jgi:hypothetical protein
MGRERHGKILVKGGEKAPTRRGIEFSRQGLPKIYPNPNSKISPQMKAALKKRD